MPTALTDLFRYPIVQAPMAGGISCPRLAAAVAEAGGLGFLATFGCPTRVVLGSFARIGTRTVATVAAHPAAPAAQWAGVRAALANQARRDVTS